MRGCGTIYIAAALVMLAGCGAPETDTEAQRAELMQVSREWAKAAASGDVDRILSYWADDAIVMPPDQPALVGKEAIRGYVIGSQSIPGFSITWEPERARVVGDLGYLVERNRLTLTDPEGVSRTSFGKVVTVWRKDSNGAWKCVVDIWNNNPKEQALARHQPAWR